MTPRDEAIDLRRETVLVLQEMDIAVEYSHHEVAPSQHEIDLRYTDALTMADNVMTHRYVVKEVAAQHDVYATFMPKPVFGQNGSGMHVHMSLFKGDKTPSTTAGTDITFPLLPSSSQRVSCATRRRLLRSRTSGSTRTSVSCPGTRRLLT